MAPEPELPESTSALVLSSVSKAPPKQQIVVAQRNLLADKVLDACGLARSGKDDGESPPENDSIDDESIAKMQEVMRTRGVRKRLVDDFDLDIGEGKDVAEDETEVQFVNRAILALRKAEVKDIIRAFDRVEKNNRKAVTKDIAFAAQQSQARQKVAMDEAIEQAEDKQFGTLHKGSPEQFAEEFEGWWKQLTDEKDFTAWCGIGVSQERKNGGQQGDDLLGDMPLEKVRDALEYFRSNTDSEELSSPPSALSLDVAAIKAELDKWSPALVISAYRKLSLSKHPDKEGGSPEAFQQLMVHAKALTEASVRYHSKSDAKGAKTKADRNKKQSAGSAARSSPKVAICTELPERLKIAIAFFGFSEDGFHGGTTAELKKLRLVLSATKERKEKEIQREKDTEKLSELLRSYMVEQPEEDGEAEVKEETDLKRQRALCTSLCRKHYQALYAHILKLK